MSSAKLASSTRASLAASSAHWLRISGIAMISQKAARVSGPTANKPPRRNAVAVDDRAIRAGLDADMQRIDPRQAPVEQAAHGRIGGGEGIFDDPGAIDDGADLHAEDFTLAASAVANPGAGFVRLDAGHLRRHHGQTAIIKRMRDASFHLGRHAMAMYVPPGARMFEEAAFGGRWKLAPEPLGVWPQAVDDAAPVPTLGDVRVDPAAEPAQQVADAGAERNFRFLDANWIHAAMGFRQQAAPGHRDDRSAVSIMDERLDVVDHRQPGAEDQHGGVRIDAGRGRRHPGIGIAWRTGSDIVAGRENDDIADIESAVIQPDDGLTRLFADVDACALHDRRAGAMSVLWTSSAGSAM